VFEVCRIYCSDITGLSVRPFPDLVFEVERILQVNESNVSFCTIREIISWESDGRVAEIMPGIRFSRKLQQFLEKRILDMISAILLSPSHDIISRMGQKITFDALTRFLGYLMRYSDRRDEMLLMDDLARFDICDVERLSVLIGKHWDMLRNEEKEFNALIRTATLIPFTIQ